jgi:hypothetical protein
VIIESEFIDVRKGLDVLANARTLAVSRYRVI